MDLPAQTPKPINRYNGRLFLALILCVAAVGIFLVPWYVPVTEPAMGQSYSYNFNNSVAIMAVGATLLALFFHALWAGRDPGVERLIASIFEIRRDSFGFRALLPLFFATAAVIAVLILACYWYSPFDHWGEMGYFISRMDLLILGRVPYHDFPFPYGPAMVYLPFALYRIAHGLLSIEQAYCAILVLHWLAGLYAMLWCIRVLFPPLWRARVFLVFAVCFFSPILGCNYAPLRFVAPIAAILLCHQTVRRFTSGGFRPHLRVALVAFAGPFVNFELSPEMGIAVTLALLIYFGQLLRTPMRRLAYGAFAAVMGMLAVALSSPREYLGILTSFGDAMSLPVFPGLAILLLLAGAFFLVPRMALAGLMSRDATGPACLAMSALSGNLIVPALSRCDLGHVFLNGLPLLLLLVAVLARLPDGSWCRWGLVAIFVVFTLLGNWIPLFHCGAFFRMAAADRASRASHPMPPLPPASHGFLFSKDDPPQEGLDPLLAYGNLATPLGCSEDIEHFLLLHGRYVTGYNPGNCSDVRMLAQTDRQWQDVAALRTILVPKDYLIPATSATEQFAMDTRFLRGQLLFPVKLVQRHPFFNPDQLLAARIHGQFSVVGEFRDYLVMVNRSRNNN